MCVNRESDKGGSSAAASVWPSRPTDHRSSGSALTSYGGTRSKFLLCLTTMTVN